MIKAHWQAAQNIGRVALVSSGLLWAGAAGAQTIWQLPDRMSPAEAASAVANAVPMQRQLSGSPRGLSDSEALSEPAGEPSIALGNRGPRVNNTEQGLHFDADAETAPVGTENYGQGNKNTIFHYNDYLQEPYPPTYYPWRATGIFVFLSADFQTYQCSASLIARSIIVLAGHCVHEGGQFGEWIQSASFFPAKSGTDEPYGYCNVASVWATKDWRKFGELDQGYDVGLALCDKRVGTSREIGKNTGYYSFCFRNCLQNYWFMTQLGYSDNYYDGELMTASQHLEISDDFDYYFGTGMQSGSSGGPHVSNIGQISDSSPNLGKFAERNVIYGVTSWGWFDESLKLQGASPLSGPVRDTNRFRRAYNAMCEKSRALHGNKSCSLL